MFILTFALLFTVQMADSNSCHLFDSEVKTIIHSADGIIHKIKEEIKNQKCLTKDRKLKVQEYKTKITTYESKLQKIKNQKKYSKCRKSILQLPSIPHITDSCKTILSPPPPNYLEVQVGLRVNYSANSEVLSKYKVVTNINNSNNDHVLTVIFLNGTAIPMLSNGTKLPTLNIPHLSNIIVNESVVNSINIAATYIATQVNIALTLEQKISKRKLLRTLLDNPGCDDFPDTACTIPCCAQHDKCYHDNDCTASSWIYGSLACINCNNIVVDCVYAGATLSCSECAAPVGQSCYDNTCNAFYDCPGGCPCSSIFSTPLNGCCECLSPCHTPSPTPTPTPTPIQTPSPSLYSSSCSVPDICASSCDPPNIFECPENYVYNDDSSMSYSNQECGCAGTCPEGCGGNYVPISDCSLGILFCACPMTITVSWTCIPIVS